MGQMLSPEKFVENFGPALQEYLEMQYREEGHILDFMAAASDFFGVSFHSVSAAIDAGLYTNPVTEGLSKPEVNPIPRDGTSED